MKPRIPESPPDVPTTHLVLDHQRCVGDRVAVGRVGDLRLPQRAAAFRIDGHDHGVAGPH